MGNPIQPGRANRPAALVSHLLPHDLFDLALNPPYVR